jgi:predicted XRE-type DNA-binding protein
METNLRDALHEILAEKIRYCKSNGLNQTQIAAFIGITQQQVSLLMNYKKYRRNLSYSIERLFGYINKLSHEPVEIKIISSLAPSEELTNYIKLMKVK